MASWWNINQETVVQGNASNSTDDNETIAADQAHLHVPPRLARPGLNERLYSAHVYRLNSTNPQTTAIHEVAEPERAYISRRDSTTWPLQSIVTVRPAGLRSRPSQYSVASSGISIEEVDPPSEVLENITARGPGTFRVDIRDIVNANRPLSVADRVVDAAEVTYDVHEVDSYDRAIATKESLQQLVTANPLPEVNNNTWQYKLRYGFFSAYRRLHALVLIANGIAISVMISRSVRHPGSFSYQDATTAVAANLFAASLCRHEHFINSLFRMCIAIPHWVPLSIRRHAAKVYSYGGVHSACGISALLWYIFFSVLMVDQFQPKSDVETYVASAITAAVLFDFAVLVGMALPKIRAMFHDQWELTHRFGGWIGVALVWAQLMIVTVASAKVEHGNFGIVLASTPAFWYLCAITCLFIYPWLRLRRRKIEATKLSSHAVMLKILHNRRQSTCKGTKLSHSPLIENHGFATIPNGADKKGYWVLVSKAGDWTTELINRPPSHIWMRGAPTIGVSRVAQLFKSTVVVATGSGIGPCLSWLEIHPNTPENPCRLIWSARFPEATYGTEMMKKVFNADPGALVIDTKVTGRKPELLEVIYAVWQSSHAEAVIIISNPRVTREVVYGLETRKVPAFGAIFDS